MKAGWCRAPPTNDVIRLSCIDHNTAVYSVGLQLQPGRAAAGRRLSDRQQQVVDRLMGWTLRFTAFVHWASMRREAALPASPCDATHRRLRAQFQNLASCNIVWVKKSPPPWSLVAIFPKRLGIFQPNFTCLLRVPIYARVRIFIQLAATLTKFVILSVTTQFTSCAQDVRRRLKRTLTFSPNN